MRDYWTSDEPYPDNPYQSKYLTSIIQITFQLYLR